MEILEIVNLIVKLVLFVLFFVQVFKVARALKEGDFQEIVLQMLQLNFLAIFVTS